MDQFLALILALSAHPSLVLAADKIKVYNRREALERIRPSKHQRNLLFASQPVLEYPACSTNGPSASDTGRNAFFDQPSVSEIESVATYMEQQGLVDFKYIGGEVDAVYADLQKYSYEDTAITQRFNTAVEYQLVPPNKADALAYLSGETETEPERFIMVTVYRGAATPRDVMQYKVGPLPVSAATVATPLLEDGEWLYSQRSEAFDLDASYWTAPIQQSIDAMEDLFIATTGVYRGEADDPWAYLSWWEYPSLNSSATDRMMRIHFMSLPPEAEGDAQGGTLLAIPLSFVIHENPDAPPDEWIIDTVEYCYKVYPSVAALMAQFNNGSVEVCSSATSEYAWTQMKPDEPYRAAPGVGLEAPRFYEPGGRRFAISGRTVEWLGWSFHVDADDLHGMTAKAISFRGEMLAYELSTMELFASYSGAGSTHQIYFHDSQWRIGGEATPLEAGLDCPHTAAFMSVTSQADPSGPSLIDRAMCVFEAPLGTSLYRHYNRAASLSGAEDTALGKAKSVLVVRTATTPGNYDYINQFVFEPDGKIDVQMIFGGYMIASYARNPTVDNVDYPAFGVPVHDHSNGILHDHIAGYKVDLDIAGTANRLQTTKIQYGTYMEATGKPKPPYVAYDGIKYAKLQQHPNESALFAHDQDFITVINQNATNKWGVPRGYDIIFESTIPRQVYPDDHPVMAAGAWMKQNLAATKRKEDEPLAAVPSNFNIGVPTPARWNLDSYMDGESIEDEDLVLWLTVGKQHYPKAEDVPVVSNFGIGFSLVPRNYNDVAAFKDIPSAQEQNYGKDADKCVP